MVDVTFTTGDALEWLHQLDTRLDSTFTSPPDADEIGATLPDWQQFYHAAIKALVAATADRGYVIVYATDRKAEGRLWSKSALIIDAAREAGAHPVWHKICYTSTGTNLFRPTYSHMITVTRAGGPGTATPDVFHAGQKIYKNAVGAHACRTAVGFLKSKGVTKLADPFCGRGSIAYHAATMGISSVNVDIDREQVEAAARLVGSLT